MALAFLPPAVKKGDKVALIAPSSPVASKDLLDYALEYFKGLGLVPVLGRLAESDYGRASDVNWAFADSSIKGIFCLRGGYGAQRILDKICFKNIKANPKIFCGFSDATALHIAINHV